MIVRDGMQQSEVPVTGLVGHRATSVTLFARDVHQLAQMNPNALHAWLCESLLGRFRPVKLEGEE